MSNSVSLNNISTQILPHTKMFFVLSNYKKPLPFKVSITNNLYNIKTELDNLQYSAIEDNSPVQYFCSKHNSDGVFSKEDIAAARHFTVQMLFEKDPSQLREEFTSYKNLIHDFGDKKSKSRLNKNTFVSYVQKDPITFNVENQILPSYNKSAESPKEAYSIEYMFSDNVLSGFSSMEGFDELDDFIKNIQNVEGMECYIFALDCLYKTLINKTVNERHLCDYLFFYDEIKDSLVKSRLTPLLKDQLIVKFYIMLLIVSDYELNLEEIPRFFSSREKVQTFLKIIGCSITKSGKVTLEFLPMDTFSSKKRRK